MIDDVYFNGERLPRSNISASFIPLSALIDTVSFFPPSPSPSLISPFFRAAHLSEVQPMSSNTFSMSLETEVNTPVLIRTASHSPLAVNYFLSILEIWQLRPCLILSRFVTPILLRRILLTWVDISLVGVWESLF
jgi:hypothetical protein